MAEASPVELLSIGTELLLGRIQDTNSYWLALQLGELGATVQRITVIGDHQPTIVAALRDAAGRGARTVIATGGLGPTDDDLSVAALAEVLGVDTEVHRPTLEEYLRRRGLREDQVSPAMTKMATIPRGTVVTPNPAGWAPCIRGDLGETAIFLLPGPPREMEALFIAAVAPRFGSVGRTQAARVVVNMWESEIAPLLQQVMAALPGTYLKAYVAQGERGLMPVDVVAQGPDPHTAGTRLEEALNMLEWLVGEAGRQLHR